MDEEISIINTNTRIEKTKNFIIKYKKNIIILISVLILTLIGFFGYSEYLNKKRLKISELYNSATINFVTGENTNIKDQLISIIHSKDPAYSPLALYFIIENEIIPSKEEVNNYFDILINDVNLEKEIKYLIIYKKGLYNSDTANENELLEIINPIIKSNSIWESHALYLIAEYFYSKQKKQKAKEFYNQIVNLEKANNIIKFESEKRLNRDLSEK